MKIYGNNELLDLKVKIDANAKKFAYELEEINNQYNPSYIRLEKRRSNIMYYIVMTLFLLLFISIAVFLEVLYALYLILLLYGINVVLTGIGVFLYSRVSKEYYLVKGEWDKEYKRILKYQDEIKDLYKLAEVEVYKVITLSENYEELEKHKNEKRKYERYYEEKLKETKARIEKDLGTDYTSEAVVLYYDQWADKLTNDREQYDFLEARKRKAELRSGKVDIDSKNN